MMWLDDEGGVMWLRRHLRWFLAQSFTWEDLLDTPLLLPAHTEVSIVSALSGERLVFDTLPNMRFWDRRAMIIRKVTAHFPDTAYLNGLLLGRLNALQHRLCGIALPRDPLDSILMHLRLTQATCREIIPAAHLFSRLGQNKRLGTVLWVVLFRRMHCYFIDEMGMRMCRTLDMPIDMTALGEEVKKIHRYLLGQKCLSNGDLLMVRCLSMTETMVVQNLPALDLIEWYVEPTPFDIRQLWQRYRRGMNCAPPYLRRTYLWRYWNRLAWYAAGIMLCSIVVMGVRAVTYYFTVQQQLQQMQLRTSRVTHDKKVVGKAAKTLLAIASYRQKYAQSDYEVALLRLSHILVDFPLWRLESIEWQEQVPRKMRLIGKWQTVAGLEQLSMRLERALTRQLQAKLVRTSVVNLASEQTELMIYFDMPDEEG